MAEEFKIGEYYEFLLEYPEINQNEGFNNWKQKIFPLDSTQPDGPDIGYFLDFDNKCTWTLGYWQGLSRTTPVRQSQTNKDGTFYRDYRGYTIGARAAYENTVNQFPGPNISVSQVSLWIRVPSALTKKLVFNTCIIKMNLSSHLHLFLMILLQ